jgi:hypothetical protein
MRETGILIAAVRNRAAATFMYGRHNMGTQVGTILEIERDKVNALGGYL